MDDCSPTAVFKSVLMDKLRTEEKEDIARRLDRASGRFGWRQISVNRTSESFPRPGVWFAASFTGSSARAGVMAPATVSRTSAMIFDMMLDTVLPDVVFPTVEPSG